MSKCNYSGYQITAFILIALGFGCGVFGICWEYKGIENTALEKFADLGIKFVFEEIDNNDELDIESLLNS